MDKYYKVCLLFSFIILVLFKNAAANNFRGELFISPLLTIVPNVQFNDTTADNAKPLIKKLLMTLRYPKACRDNKVYGKVVIKFVITANKRVQQIQPMQSPDDLLTNEVINALNNCTVPPRMVQGTYIIPISFVLNGLNDSDTSRAISVKQYSYSPSPANATTLSEIVISANVDY